jgi:hypothetical protein
MFESLDVLCRNAASPELNVPTVGWERDAFASWKSCALAPRQTAFDIGFSPGATPNATTGAKAQFRVIGNAALQGPLFHGGVSNRTRTLLFHDGLSNRRSLSLLCSGERAFFRAMLNSDRSSPTEIPINSWEKGRKASRRGEPRALTPAGDDSNSGRERVRLWTAAQCAPEVECHRK